MSKLLKLFAPFFLLTTFTLSLDAHDGKNAEEVKALCSKYELLHDKFVKGGNIQNLFNYLKEGDTIRVNSTAFNIEYVIPDTLWKKHKKKPKLNKHYALQYIWKGVPTSEINEFGFPIYKQPSQQIICDFIFVRYDISNSSGNGQLIIRERATNRDLRLFIDEKSSLEISSNAFNRLIGESIIADTIYFVRNEGLKETDYGYLVVRGAKYSASLRKQHFRGTLDVKTKGESYPVTNGKLELWGKKIISRREYDDALKNIRKDKEFLSLAIVNGITSDLDYRFMSDTMAVYKMMKDTVEPLGEITKYYCYAYGQSYVFSGDNIVTMLVPSDGEYLLSKGVIGEDYRLTRAKKWDEKNLWLSKKDEIWDKDSCILAKILGDCHLIDDYGMSQGPSLNESAKKPKKGMMVPVAMYGHDAGYISTFRIFYKGEYFAVKFENLKFNSLEDSKYLMRRGPRGYKQRVLKVISHDLAETFLENLKEEAKKYENYQKKQIFLLGMETYDSGYDWDGIEFKIYNCFKKTIKYVNITVTAYNYFGDMQGDLYGRTTKDIRCIGPLAVDEGGSFKFDDMFNNKSGIICSYKPTKVKITFIDNSTISYSTWPKIKPHSDL